MAAAAAAANAALLQQQQAQIAELLAAVGALQNNNPAGAAAAAAAGAGAAPAVYFDPAFNEQSLALARRAAAQPPPTFRGGTSGLETHRWLQGIELYFEEAGIVTDGDRLRAAARALAAHAATWWEAQRQVPLADPKKIKTWAEFTAALRKRFEPTDVGQWGRSELASLVGRGMANVKAYTEAYMELMTLVTDMSEADRVFQYRNGLPAALRQQLANKSNEWLTLQQNVEAAIRIEANRLPSSSSSSSSGGGSGYRGWSNKQGQKPASFNALEEEDDSAESESASLAEALRGIQAQLNALSSSSSSANRGGKKSSWTGKSSGKIPGLEWELINARMKAGVCIKCNAKGHMKGECQSPADLTSLPQGK